MLLTLAWRNVWRNKKRSLIIILAIAFGLWGGLMAGAIMMGWGESMVTTAIDRDLGHVQIHSPGFRLEQELTNQLPGGFQILQRVRALPQVQSACGHVVLEGMASSATSNFGVQIYGIVPEEEAHVTIIHQKLITGSYFREQTRNPAVIGAKLAERLGVKLHSRLVLGFQGLNGELVYLAVRVVGIYKTESTYFDESHLFLRQSDLFRVIGVRPFIHEITIRARHSRLVPALLQTLRQQYPDLDVASWKEIAPEIAYMAASMDSFTYLFLAIILFALLFGITNTMLMAVVERFRELGVLLAVGMTRVRIFVMILLETILLSLTGGLAGIIMGVGTLAVVGQYGLDLSAFESSLASFGASAILYPYLPLEMYVVLTIMILLTALVGAALPAWKAVHIQPAQATRIV